ncbi:hypothetical protein BB561_005787 [Smittium simulii]|uniref:N-acyl-aliphatic-L-amino acid amidohydrolase n=1 Tax=Smittium simulii TaxID=133385 RepID=A0A2T9Y8B7_9FUNG|nr:hypothetical protein BB561_005787 [Smittium simulii]
MTVAEPDCISRFREFVRIKTVHPNPDYEASKQYLISQAKDIGLTYQVVECVKGKPIVILGLEGSDPSLQSIMLGSHIDVVPVFEVSFINIFKHIKLVEFWTYPPFAAERVPTEDGDFKIYGRGSQDMKCTSCMHLEALRKIVNSGTKLKRTVYAVLAPDEEIGGYDGVNLLVDTFEFKNLNVGFDLDEGMLAADERYSVSYSERINGQVRFTAHGNTGHGSQFIEGTAIEKLLPVINALMDRREIEKKKLAALNDGKTNLRSGESIAINLTQLGGGKQANVVPATFSAVFDIRITPLIDSNEFKNWIIELAHSYGVEYEFLHPKENKYISTLDRSNPFVDAFFASLAERNIIPIPIICPATSDCRHVRRTGIPVYGFVPIKNHQMLAHDHDEYVLESEFLNGIDIYVDVIIGLASV